MAGTYQGVENDLDLNKFTQSDIEDLTSSMIGESIRAVVIWATVIISIFVILFFLRFYWGFKI